MKVATCPGCDSKQAVMNSKAESFTEIRNNFTFVQDSYNILNCVRCGLYYKDNVLSQQELDLYYNNTDFQLWHPAVPFPTETAMMEILSENLKANQTILDFGCSDGRFLESFVDKAQCFGFDIDTRALEIARGRGLTILSQEELSKREFDFIVLSDVFEHIARPTAFLKFLFSRLSNKGMLIICTGYADAKSCEFNLADYWYFKTVQHLTMLGERYITYIQNELGASIYAVKRCSHYNENLLKKAAAWINFSVRFFLYRTVTIKKESLLHRTFSKLPILKKINRWYTQPFYPYFKDHIIVCLKK